MWLIRLLPRFVAGLMAFVTGVVCYSYGSQYGGKFEAQVNVLRGSYSIRLYGTQNPGIIEYKEILSNEYGVELVVIGGCTISREKWEKTDSYNEVMEAAIEKRHGKGVLERSWRMARADYERKPEMKFRP